MKRTIAIVCGGDTSEFQVSLRSAQAVSYTHLRAHETGRNLVCRLLLEKKKKKKKKYGNRCQQKNKKR